MFYKGCEWVIVDQYGHKGMVIGIVDQSGHSNIH